MKIRRLAVALAIIGVCDAGFAEASTIDMWAMSQAGDGNPRA